MAKKNEKEMCCRFPTFAVILLAVGLIWLLNDLNVIAVNVPWIPLIIVIVAIGMIFNRFGNTCKC